MLKHVRAAGLVEDPGLPAVVDVYSETDLLLTCRSRLIGLALELGVFCRWDRTALVLITNVFRWILP